MSNRIHSEEFASAQIFQCAMMLWVQPVLGNLRSVNNEDLLYSFFPQQEEKTFSQPYLCGGQGKVRWLMYSLFPCWERKTQSPQKSQLCIS